jgi:hypothetical protein
MAERLPDEERGGRVARRELSEVTAQRRGDRPVTVEVLTVGELVDRLLATHEVDPATTAKLRYELRHASREFGGSKLTELRAPNPSIFPSDQATMVGVVG